MTTDPTTAELARIDLERAELRAEVERLRRLALEACDLAERIERVDPVTATEMRHRIATIRKVAK